MQTTLELYIYEYIVYLSIYLLVSERFTLIYILSCTMHHFSRSTVKDNFLRFVVCFHL